MSFGSAVVAIVLILAITALSMQWAENRKDARDRPQGERQRDRERELETERDEARSELSDLRERVKVLERIATDPSRRTAEEIENLRD